LKLQLETRRFNLSELKGIRASKNPLRGLSRAYILPEISGLLMTDPAEHVVHRMVLEALPLGVYVVNRDGKIILWSAGAEQLSGYLRQDVLGRLREEELWEGSATETTAPQEQHASPIGAMPDGRPVAAQLSLRTKNGRFVQVELKSVPLCDDSGRILGAAKIFHPLCVPEAGARRQDKLGAFGALDPLTGLLNHSMIQAHLKESLSLHSLYPVPFSVLCYSIDDLPKLRERNGQAAVDATLRTVARTMENGLHQTDFVGHWRDEEFLAILPECGESDVMKVGERLRKLVQRAGVEWWGDTLYATVSIGATIARDSDTVGSLVGRAEEALCKCAKEGGNRVVVISA
jgi:diguanylate cyclase (GGDEF)-like protein/PAS domain S-box-containing protein